MSKGKDNIKFKTVIAPSDPNYDVRELENILCEIHWFCAKNLNLQKWLVKIKINK